VSNTQKTATVKEDILTYIAKRKIWLKKFVLHQTKTIKYLKISSDPEISPETCKIIF